MAVLAENGQDADISVLGQPGCDMSCPYPFVMFACQKLDIRVGALLDVNGAKCQSQDRRPADQTFAWFEENRSIGDIPSRNPEGDLAYLLTESLRDPLRTAGHDRDRPALVLATCPRLGQEL